MGSPHQLNLNPHSQVIVLLCLATKLELSHPMKFTCYLRTRMRCSQFLNLTAGSRPSHRADMIDHRAHELLIKPYTNYDCLGKSNTKQKWDSFNQQIGCKFKEETSEMLHLECNFDAETCTLQEVDQKYLGSFEMWYQRRMEKLSCTDCVKN